MKNIEHDFLIEDLVPHAPPMRMVDSLVSYSETAVIVRSHIHEDHAFAQSEGVPAHVALEIMAQACAVWAGVEARHAGGRAQVGLLLGSRNCRIAVPFFAFGDTLTIHADLVFREGGMAIFDSRIEIAGRLVAQATLNVYQPEDGNLSRALGMVAS